MTEHVWKCPQCGRTYPQPGTCAVQHPAAELVDVAAAPPPSPQPRRHVDASLEPPEWPQ